MRLLHDPRLLPLVLALGWAGFYGSVAASNATDVLGVDWSKFMALIVAALVSLMASEACLRDCVKSPDCPR